MNARVSKFFHQKILPHLTRNFKDFPDQSISYHSTNARKTQTQKRLVANLRLTFFILMTVYLQTLSAIPIR